MYKTSVLDSVKNECGLGLHCFTLLRVPRPQFVRVDETPIPDTVYDFMRLGLQRKLISDISCPPIVGTEKIVVLETVYEFVRLALRHYLLYCILASCFQLSLIGLQSRTHHRLQLSPSCHCLTPLWVGV